MKHKFSLTAMLIALVVINSIAFVAGYACMLFQVPTWFSQAVLFNG